MLPFELASLLPGQCTRADSAPRGPCHVPVWMVGRLVGNQVRELIHGKEKRGERCLWWSVFFSQAVFPTLS